QRDYRIGKAVVDALEDAWGKVGSDLNFYPREKIAVVVYTGRQFQELLDKPKNVGGVYDGKIRLPVGGLDAERDCDALKKVLAHEYAHAVIHFLTHNRCPLWLNEGIAEYVSETWDKGRGDRVAGALEAGMLIPLSELSASLKNVHSPKLGLAYAESFSIVKFIANRFGVYTLRRILDNLDAGDDQDAALRKAISLDGAGFEKEWRQSLADH
ncbi:MAG: peptidase MA family metallohydrolase, partial [Candidatus Aureabacteria bacterium]|nr:peptidase MA family metallohydrolase [Candidatus Auribacterota bacterium]